MSISEQLFQRALKLIPGGVNSPVRSFKYVGGNPIYIERAEGAKVYTVDSQELSDFIMSWGAIILGHSHPYVNSSVIKAVELGTSFGLCHEREIIFADFLASAIPHFIFRSVSSGTEATMSVVRLARAFTRKKYLLKFSGCYHGHSDQFLTKGGTGLATLGITSSDGVPHEFVSCTITLEYNVDRDELEYVFEKYDIACAILEIIPGNMGVVPPREEFIKKLYDLCLHHNSVLIYDEVITGFRVGWGGVSGTKKVDMKIFDSGGEKNISFDVPVPDMITFGKVVGGGFPIGVFGGKREIMELVAPLGSVYQAGTLSGNPVSLSGGIATLEFIRSQKDFYATLTEKTFRFARELWNAFSEKSIAVSIVSTCGMLSVFFSEKVPFNFDDVSKNSDVEFFKFFFHRLLENDVIIPPSPFEAWFVSWAHSDDDFLRVLETIRKL